MNFDPIYLRYVKQYCHINSYLNNLPRDLQIYLGQYLSYSPREKFTIRYYNNVKAKLLVRIADDSSYRISYMICEFKFVKEDQEALKRFLSGLINNEPVVLNL